MEGERDNPEENIAAQLAEDDREERKRNYSNPNKGGYDEHTIRKAQKTSKDGDKFINCDNVSFYCRDDKGVNCDKHGVMQDCKYCPDCPVCGGMRYLDKTILISAEHMESMVCINCGYRDAGERVSMESEKVFGQRNSIERAEARVGVDPKTGVPFCAVLGCEAKAWDRKKVTGITKDGEHVCQTHYHRAVRCRRKDIEAIIRNPKGFLIDNPEVKIYTKRSNGRTG